MTISIITPAYNDSNFLEGNIKSILNQKHEGVEHIVMDAGSTDGTLELLKSYPHLRWVSEPDRGMYDAINKGIQIASGDIIAYLNADDRYYDDTLEMVSKTFQDNPDIDFIYGYCTYIDKNERPIGTFRLVPFVCAMPLKVRISWAQPSCFWRKRVHEKIGLFDENMKYSGDMDFFSRLLAQGCKGLLVRKPLSKFMVRDDCISKKGSKQSREEENMIYKRYSLNKRSPLYWFHELLYYLVNVDAYFYYLRSKSVS